MEAAVAHRGVVGGEKDGTAGLALLDQPLRQVVAHADVEALLRLVAPEQRPGSGERGSEESATLARGQRGGQGDRHAA